MKTAIMFTTAALFVSALAFANDMENKESTTVDHSKNPITGTEKTTKKHKAKMKDGHGNESDATVKEVTKTKKDGTTTKEVSVDSDSSSEKH